MEIKSVLSYLINRQVFQEIILAEQINVGASGAKLFKVIDGNKSFVLKLAHKSFHDDKSLVASYKKELEFYQLNRTLEIPYVPETVYSEIHDEYGCILVMKYYPPVEHHQWSEELQKNAVDLCARLNSISLESVSPLHLPQNKIEIDWTFTEKSYQEWKLVLSQHEGRFDTKMLDEIYANIDIVCPILNNEPHYVCHGDFHPENMLHDGDKLYICDWQNIQIGKCIGDISFFISRGIGFGINMNADDLLDYYCERLSKYRGMNISKTVLLREKHASTVLNTFSFWAYYLKNCSYERVAGQFNDMVNSYKYLVDLG
ncbi:MAG: aminoglycoside phosphotransferase family protein [Oscillospiraceae bacterium]